MCHGTFFGKGFAYNGTDYYLTTEAVRRGVSYPVDEATLICGSYHQGILTLLIPFGIWGLLLFGWFCWSALGVLIRNYRYGSESLRLINVFLLSMFICRLVFFIFLYGQFELDIPMFVGLIGLSISLNGVGKRGNETTAPGTTP